MDFEYTSRPSSSTPPVWAANGNGPTTPKKRTWHTNRCLNIPNILSGPLGETVTPTSPFPGTPHTPTFGRMHNVPFVMNVPAPQTPQVHAWNPHEMRDIDMVDASPPQPSTRDQDENDDREGSARKIATGGLVRVFKSRQKQRAKSRLATTQAQVEDEESEAESEQEGIVTPITQNTSNHYTLNIPGPVAPRSDTPYVLLGYVTCNYTKTVIFSVHRYLQFFFNSSLVLLFLYLLVQFILTVQRDVEHRISEYSMGKCLPPFHRQNKCLRFILIIDIVQEIAQCAIHFRDNRCENPLPAMVHQCGVWDTCMNRDPTKVGRAKVGAELIAEVINGFVEPISWKTLVRCFHVLHRTESLSWPIFVDLHHIIPIILDCLREQSALAFQVAAQSSERTEPPANTTLSHHPNSPISTASSHRTPRLGQVMDRWTRS